MTTHAKRLGDFRTPRRLAEWVADEIMAAAMMTGLTVRRAIDPACGEGSLLQAMRRASLGSLELTGIEISPAAAAQCSWNLGLAATIVKGDALNPNLPWGNKEQHAVIMNPPWGAIFPQSKQYYRDSGYRLAVGQFDISDIFVERALMLTKPGAVLGFILPDTLHHPEHQPLRNLLLQHTLLLVARLGEGIFDGVYRSTAVIILRNGAAHPNHMVECLSLSPAQRRLLGKGSLTFKEVKAAHSHCVLQSRFQRNPHSAFNVSQNETSHAVYEHFSSVPRFDWTPSLHLGRGIEIGKRGYTVRCEHCGNHRPLSRSNTPMSCPACNRRIPAHAPVHTIIHPTAGPGRLPLIVGEDVDRYAASPSRSINEAVPGIRYKPTAHFAKKKLLVRKTGVGLRAAVDHSGAATVQTVFYAVSHTQNHDWLLDYLQGVINSRPMLAWYLQWSGENQWRSHPYVTPKVLRTLPIPDPLHSERAITIAREIAEYSSQVREGSTLSDHLVDEAVCRLYNLGSEGMVWVKKVLAATEHQLEYFKRMRNNLGGKAVSASMGRMDH